MADIDDCLDFAGAEARRVILEACYTIRAAAASSPPLPSALVVGGTDDPMAASSASLLPPFSLWATAPAVPHAPATELDVFKFQLHLPVVDTYESVPTLRDAAATVQRDIRLVAAGKTAAVAQVLRDGAALWDDLLLRHHCVGMLLTSSGVELVRLERRAVGFIGLTSVPIGSAGRGTATPSSHVVVDVEHVARHAAACRRAVLAVQHEAQQQVQRQRRRVVGTTLLVAGAAAIAAACLGNRRGWADGAQAVWSGVVGLGHVRVGWS